MKLGNTQGVAYLDMSGIPTTVTDQNWYVGKYNTANYTNEHDYNVLKSFIKAVNDGKIGILKNIPKYPSTAPTIPPSSDIKSSKFGGTTGLKKNHLKIVDQIMVSNNKPNGVALYYPAVFWHPSNTTDSYTLTPYMKLYISESEPNKIYMMVGSDIVKGVYVG